MPCCVFPQDLQGGNLGLVSHTEANTDELLLAEGDHAVLLSGGLMN